MPSYNTLMKVGSLADTKFSGSTSDKLNSLAGGLNTFASILDEFSSVLPGEGVAFAGSELLTGARADLSGTLVFPYKDLGSSEFPSFIEITGYDTPAPLRGVAENFSRSLVDIVVSLGEGALTLAKDIAEGKSSDEILSDAGKAKDSIGNSVSSLGAAGKGALNGLDSGSLNHAKFQTQDKPLFSIALPVQGKMGEQKTSPKWGVGELGGLGGYIAENGISSMFTTKKGATDALSRSLLGAAMETQELGGAIQAMSGSILNPFSYQLYSGVDHRGFSFSWLVVPRNADETKIIHAIHDTVRYHSLASKSGFMLLTPGNFRIAFKHVDEDGKVSTNPYYPITLPCVCSDVSLTPETAETHDDGSPVAYTLSMTFSEVEPLTKEKIREAVQVASGEGNKKSSKQLDAEVFSKFSDGLI